MPVVNWENAEEQVAGRNGTHHSCVGGWVAWRAAESISENAEPIIFILMFCMHFDTILMESMIFTSWDSCVACRCLVSTA